MVIDNEKDFAEMHSYYSRTLGGFKMIYFMSQ